MSGLSSCSFPVSMNRFSIETLLAFFTSPEQILTMDGVHSLVYNARKRGSDKASEYFKRTENIAGVKDMRFQALMPDVSDPRTNTRPLHAIHTFKPWKFVGAALINTSSHRFYTGSASRRSTGC